jgi:hypothetical protein
MKTFLKFLAVIFFILSFLVLGHYFALNNLGSMLAADHNGLKCRWVSSGLEIETGGRVENIQLKLPVTVRHHTGQWVIQTNQYSLIIFTLPRIHLRWQKVNGLSPHNKILPIKTAN